MIGPRLQTAVALLALALASCTTLRVDDWRLAADDWTTEGGSAERLHSTPTDVVPPLELAWSANVDALPSARGASVGGRHVVVPTRRGDLVVLRVVSGSRVGRARLGGALAGSPLLVGDLAVVTLAAGAYSVMAYSLRDGRIRWRAQEGPLESSAVRHGLAVVTASTDGSVTARGLHDGEKLWSVRPDTLAGFHASPMAAGSMIIVADDRGTVSALDAAAGVEVWRSRLSAPVHATPSRAGHLAIFSTTRGASCALRLSDGSITWCFDVEDPTVRLTAPAVTSTRVLIGATDGSLTALDIATGAPIWTFQAPAGLSAPATITGRFAYAGGLDGRVFAVDMQSGELVWSGEVQGRIHAPVIPAGDGILVLSAPRHVTAFRPVPASRASPR